MADSKISALPASTTPLGGTEVLPIVQGGATKQVSVANLTAGRTVSALQYQAAINSATTWTPNTSATNIQINNSAAAANSTSLFQAQVLDDASTTGGVKFGAVAVASGTSGGYSADFVIANRKTGTYQENMRVAWNGDVTVNTGNLVIGTSGKGIDFSATASGSGTMTSELLADYEEGTWTPSQGAGLTVVGAFSSAGRYTKIGRLVTLSGFVQGGTTVAVSSGNALTSNLPFTTGANGVGVMIANNQSLGGQLVAAGTDIYTTGMTAVLAIYFTVTYSV